jgi:sporulation integral membrane protein YtvI
MVADNEVGIGDRLNMAFSSTSVSYGRGEGVVVYTGMDTEIGKIAAMISESTEELTPLQKRLNDLGKVLGIVAVVIVVAMFGIAVLQGRDIVEMFITAIALAVAAVPEGLTAVVTIVLALGVTKMVRVNTIVRKLPAVETLGAVSIVCSDKTGTLTQNKMTVTKVYLDGEIKNTDDLSYENNKVFLDGFILCNDASIANNTRIGDPTELALLDMGDKINLSREGLEKTNPRINEQSFDSARKLMTESEKKKFILDVAFIVTVYAVLYFIFVYVIHWVMPFIVGFLIALALRPVTRFVNRFVKSTGKGVALFVITMFYVVLAIIIWFLTSFFITQISGLIHTIPRLYFNRIEPVLLEFNDWVVQNAETLSPNVASTISQIITNGINYLADFIKNISISFVQLATRLISNFPLYLISVIFTIVLSVFISLEYDNITAFFRRQMPEKFKDTFEEARKFITGTLWKMIKSYILIMIITFIETFTGLSILKVNYALPIAAIIAVLDVMPVLGTGGVLIPWAIFEFILKNYFLGFGLLALYIAVTVIRHIIEPRIVGHQIGLHPIITITAMYAGLRLFSVAGVILGPIVAITVKYLNDEGKIKLFK